MASQLVIGLNHNQAKEYRKHVEYLLALIFPVLLNVAQPGQKDRHLQLMQILKLILEAKILPLVLLSAVKYVHNFDQSGLASSPQQMAILRVLGSIFCESNVSQSYILQQYSLRTLELFLKTTPHTQMASNCIRDEDKQIIKEFVNRVPTKKPSGDLKAFWNEQLEFISKPLVASDPLPKLPGEIKRDLQKEGESSIVNGSIAKRPRLENEEQLQHLLSNLEQVVTGVSQLVPLPTWAKEEIRERINLLSSLI